MSATHCWTTEMPNVPFPLKKTPYKPELKALNSNLIKKCKASENASNSAAQQWPIFCSVIAAGNDITGSDRLPLIKELLLRFQAAGDLHQNRILAASIPRQNPKEVA